MTDRNENYRLLEGIPTGWDDVGDVEQAIDEIRGCPSKPDFAFTVWGRAQQRGSKQARVRYDRNGKPVTKNGRVLTFATDDNHKSKSWMQEVRHAAIAELGQIELVTAPIELTARFYFARPKSHYGSGKNAGVLKASAPRIHAQSPDLDKLTRALGDSLTGVVIHDDKLIARIVSERLWTIEAERTEVEIREIGK
ncbi:MAG: RusA family crossover junction endodeoxyribonuclease [Pirellulaceae bacterium]|nr:RusA family crossover junction endodeoxyribonuclease [Pirellulaceae bacterium]